MKVYFYCLIVGGLEGWVGFDGEREIRESGLSGEESFLEEEER